MRLSALACAGVLALGGLSACGSDDGPRKVSSEDVRPAVLTVKDLSDEFQADPDKDEEAEGGPDFGCLFDLDELDTDPDDDDDEDDDSENEAQFEASEEPGMPAVFHFVDAVPSRARAEQLMDKVSDVLKGCHEVDSTDEDGATWKLHVEFDRSAWARGADEQLNVVATGSTSADELELPVSISLSVVRIENAVSMLMFVDIAEDVLGAPRKLTSAASARLRAIVDGKDVPDPKPLLQDYPIGATFADLLGSDGTA